VTRLQGADAPPRFGDDDIAMYDLETALAWFGDRG
jgi:hypothetical protein